MCCYQHKKTKILLVQSHQTRQTRFEKCESEFLEIFQLQKSSYQ